MRMREDENIAKYVERIKASVSAMRACGGEIKEETVISKVLITLLPVYAIRVFVIQERCEENHNINLDAIVGRLTAFELDNFDNYVPSSKSIESTFEAKLSFKEKGKKVREIQLDSEEESERSSDSDIEVVKAVLAKKYSRSRGKYKGKVPLIYFSCEEIGHIVTRCPNKENKMRRKVTSAMTRRISEVTNLSRTKVIRHVLWLNILKIQIVVKMKLFTLL